MFCESYGQPLMDGAASGAGLSPELEAHLVGCTGCSRAFAVEQALFVSIDRSLRGAANGDVPSSLILRVRGAISEGALVPWRFSWRTILVPATAVLLLCAALLVIPRFVSKGSGRASGSVATTAVDVTPEASGTPIPTQPANSPKRVALAARQKRLHGTPFSPTKAQAKVEPGTQLAIERVIRLAQEQPDTAKALLSTARAPIVIEPIEVASIAWKPLSNEADGNRPLEPRR